MKKINENIKHIIVLIVAIVISSMISIKAATTLSSTSVYYDTSKSGGSSSNVNGAIDELYSLTTDRYKLKSEILNLTYPVGSIYMSTEDDTVEKVQERFGGTWVKYSSGTTLVGDDGTNYITNDETKGNGGSSTVTLSTSNLPSHSHAIPSLSGSTKAESYVDHLGVNGEYSVSPGGNTNAIVLGERSGYLGATFDFHIHSLSLTTTASNTTTCTNCSGASLSVQNPYTVVYMYKRTA